MPLSQGARIAGAVAAAAVVYFAVLIVAWNSIWIVLGTSALLAGLPLWLAHRGSRERALFLAAWPPLHLLIAGTGGLESPLLALAAAWAFTMGSRSARDAALAAAIAALVPATALALGNFSLQGAAGYVVLIGLVLAAPGLLRRDQRTPPHRDETAPSRPPEIQAGDDAEILRQVLETIRLATDAHEAALWQGTDGNERARLLAAAGLPDRPPPDREVSLQGHPFGWTLLEQTHVRLERGRRPLPAPWAAEMLLIPAALPNGVLSLAYAGAVPPGAEAAAAAAGGQLRDLAALLRIRADAGRLHARTAALQDAVRLVPGELDLRAFAQSLCAALIRGSGAEGAALAVWDSESGTGEVVWAEGVPEERRGVLLGPFRDGESRLALTAKHGVAQRSDDLRHARERLPLLVAGESWLSPPGSASTLALVADGKTLGAIAVWHSEPGCFGEAEAEFLDSLAALAPPALRSARRYQALDLRASTDALTRLPNRGSFEGRLAAAANRFARYARPFGLIVLDVDHFKRFNDTWGHEAGDRVLCHVGEMIRGTVREVDLAARLGGEEFVVLLPETGLRESVDAAERIRRRIESSPLVWGGQPLSVTASFGVAACPDSLADPGGLLAVADAALYRAKAGGRNRVQAAPRDAAAGLAPGAGRG